MYGSSCRGSSFAAGPGLPSRVPGSPLRAGRSTGNYAHLVARTLGNDVGFVPRLTLASLPRLLRVLPPVKARADALGETRGADQRFEQLERNLTAITQAAASAAGWTYVAASAASADHHAWSAAPWTRRFHLSLRGGAPYHPNAAGMAQVAELVAAALRSP